MWRSKTAEADYLSKLSNKKELLIDVPIIRSAKMELEDKGPNKSKDIISLSLNSSYSRIQRKSQSQTIPLMATVKTSDVDIAEKKLGLDLIVIVDVSSSMIGNKIELVQETLSFILGELSPQDRISIVKFSDDSQILAPLMPMTPENKLKGKNIVYSRLSCCGSTNIIKGLQDGFDVMYHRKERNDITSIFFLSDGEDTNGNNLQAFKSFLDVQEQKCNERNMDYSINCFGYGHDHDEKLMGMIASRKQGNFYYIKDLKKIDECFIDCFGKLMSTFALNAEINIFLNGDIKFVKKYGYQWDTENMLGKGRINIKTIASGFESNYLAEIQIPPVAKGEDTLKVSVAILTFDAEGEGCTISKELKIQIVDSSDLGPINARVEEELVRVKLADLVLKVEEKVESKNFLDAEKLVNDFKGQVLNNAYLAPAYTAKVCKIVSHDVKDTKYSKQVYHMASNQQRAMECEDFASFNCLQKEMLQRKRK